MAKRPITKRKATYQLTPNNEEDLGPNVRSELNDEHCNKDEKKDTVEKEDVLTTREDFKGIFSNAVNSQQRTANQMVKKMSGLNRSFFNGISTVLSKNCSKDLRYMFKQYENFVEIIEKENQNGNKLKEK
ncbi:hypothetical protein EHP00_104 [Ecytonucleospora hepatopenaei]|uniref:Uncharacterized protein n=1 Tax=Ecytonucleospora hepatopenaei TaxID=646526 RepID=A0A1W0E5Y7_9MICR|nr:hypothetical protein EHP00_104 [Ecytonucleospora hepatopenaei]